MQHHYFQERKKHVLTTTLGAWVCVRIEYVDCPPLGSSVCQRANYVLPGCCMRCYNAFQNNVIFVFIFIFVFHLELSISMQNEIKM